jgi:hypothetical protein
MHITVLFVACVFVLHAFSPIFTPSPTGLLLHRPVDSCLFKLCRCKHWLHEDVEAGKERMHMAGRETDISLCTHKSVIRSQPSFCSGILLRSAQIPAASACRRVHGGAEIENEPITLTDSWPLSLDIHTGPLFAFDSSRNTYTQDFPSVCADEMA